MIDLRCGDCLDVMKNQQLLKAVENGKICIVTDPPFNIRYKYNTYKDNLKEDEYYNFLNDVISFFGCPFIIIHYPEQLYKIAGKFQYYPTKVVSWVYNSNTAKQHRDIAFFKITPDFNKVKQPYKNPKDKRIMKRISEGKGARIYDWWEINQVKNVSKNGKIKHPCVMPVEVMERIIKIIPEDYTILDPFMGSGTTGVACINTNRNFIGIEIDETYFNIAKERINNKIKELEGEE